MEAPGRAGGLRLETSDGPIAARTVVLATGAYQRPRRPACAASLPGDLLQIDVEQYRDPADLPTGPVLVVGSGQSGCQIAEELRHAGRDVVLACGRAPWFPRRPGGRDLSWWANETGFLDVPVGSLPDPAARLAANVQATAAGGGHDLHDRTLRATGVTLVGHLLDADGRRARASPPTSATASPGATGATRSSSIWSGGWSPSAACRPRDPRAGAVRRRGPGGAEPARIRGRRVRVRLPAGRPVVGRVPRGLRRARLPDARRRPNVYPSS